MDLDDAKAFVTGSSSGLGQAIAQRLAGAGADVAVHYARNEEGAVATAKSVEEHGGDAPILQADLTEPAEARELADRAADALGGRVDVLVNNAGVIDEPGEGERGAKPFHERIPEWDRLVNVNLRAPWILSSLVAPAMAQRADDGNAGDGGEDAGGCIVNVASVAGYHTNLEVPLYSLTKNGLMHLTRQFALEFAPDVRVNAVAPGWIPTGFGWGHLESEAFQEAIVPTIPQDRMGAPEEVAEAVRVLVEDATYTTGHTMTADGGLAAKLR